MRRETRFRYATATLMSIAAFATGCSNSNDGLPREAVEIEAKIDSKPLERAFVQLLPVQPSGEATHVGGILENGRLSIPAEQGPVPGEYLVSITSGTIEKGIDNYALPGEGARPRKDAIPAKYNLKSELRATVRQGEPNAFVFDLSSR